MTRYTYTLNPNSEKKETGQTYKRGCLENMTTFQLREICRKEKLVTQSGKQPDRDELIQLIMRFRGQREYRRITSADAESIARIQDFINRCPLEIQENADIRIPGTLTLYQGIGLDALDGYRISSENPLYEGNLLLTDETNKVYTCLYIREEQGELYIEKAKDVTILPLEKGRYSILYFPDDRISEYLYACAAGADASRPGHANAVRIPLLNLEVKTVEETDMPLVIDFGSSNTTMGICLPDHTRRVAQLRGGHVIPSVIGIAGMDGENPQYVFGYQAMELCSRNYRDEDVPVFYDIKRWVSDPARRESVILKNGHKYLIERRKMLRAFLDYLLDLSRQQFKCSFRNIQMLSPVRQKEKFQAFFTELLPEYSVECGLDEGMAVLFYSIEGMIRNALYQQGKWYNALIIDCGGGTTDLTSGRFRIDNNRVSYTVDLETSYENGDTNFGGSNLTYRIFQLLKIRLAQQAGFLTDSVAAGSDVFEEAFKKAEAFLPTQFKAYESSSGETYFCVKNNFYYLFDLAEQIKKRFFQTEFLYELRIGTEEQDSRGSIRLDRWKLSGAGSAGTLERLHGNIQFSVYLNEVETILRPDIYRLMDHFLNQKFESGELSRYGMIKLTGQSCKSRLFTEALKEYVPGKRIQVSADAAGDGLKMCCLNGALTYFANCKLGYMKVNRSYEVGALPYELMAYTHENNKTVLIRSLDREDHIGWISRFKVGTQLDLYLNSEQGEALRTYCFRYDASGFAKTTPEEIEEQYGGTVIQEETDTILEGETKFFVWVDRRRWGFFVLPVLRESDQLYKGQETFFDFEDDTWELNFFDGRK